MEQINYVKVINKTKQIKQLNSSFLQIYLSKNNKYGKINSAHKRKRVRQIMLIMIIQNQNYTIQ